MDGHREKDGVWLNLTHERSGTSLGAGGDWHRNAGGLTQYVRQMADGLIERDGDFEL